MGSFAFKWETEEGVKAAKATLFTTKWGSSFPFCFSAHAPPALFIQIVTHGSISEKRAALPIDQRDFSLRGERLVKAIPAGQFNRLGPVLYQSERVSSQKLEPALPMVTASIDPDLQ